MKNYGFYLLFTLLIEFVGRFILNFWDYPSFNLEDRIIHVFLIGYPFAFFFIHESFKLIHKKVDSFSVAIIITTILNTFIHEIPNLFAQEWIYTIPSISFEILSINIVVIIGWIILISIPLITKRILDALE